MHNRHAMIMTAAVFLIISGICCFFPTGYADEVTDSIEEALKQYKKGDYRQAAGSLDYASGLMRQKKGDILQAFLPEPLPGWSAEDTSSQAIGSMIMGGGVIAERVYNKDLSRITIRVMVDSPMIQGVIMMFSNSMVMTASGGKMSQIKGQRAIIKYNPGRKEGDINIMVGNDILVIVEGANVAKEDLTAYANSIDYQKLADAK